jgi:hypothetical protein
VDLERTGTARDGQPRPEWPRSPDVVCVNPPNHPFTPPGILIEPIDLLGLATLCASRGHATRVVDMDVRRLRSADLDGALAGAWPDLAVIVCDYHIPLHGDAAMAEVAAIVAAFSARGTRTLLVGKTATYGDAGALAAVGADAYAAHDAEPALEAILSGGFAHAALASVPGLARPEGAGHVRNGGKRPRIDLSSLPVPDRSLVRLSDYIDVRTILSSRGCHMACDFCHVPGFWGGWQGRPAESVVGEIEALVRDHGAGKVLFLDDNAVVNARRMHAISGMLAERLLGVALGCLASVSRIDGALLDAMAAGGFRWVHYGAETADDGLLAAMGKRVSAKATLDAVARARSAGLRVRTSWILDTPGIGPDGLARTEEAILGSGSEEIRLHFLALRQGSLLKARNPEVEATQFIHHGRPASLPFADADAVLASRDRIVAGLEAQGYAIVRDPSEFADMDALRARSPGLKVASLCPMRYGMGWEA